jgi:hypothetical protein
MAANHDRAGAGTQQQAGSVFQDGSPACHAAMDDLGVVLKELGFVVEKKRETESTLRVYVAKRHSYPLLNPRFRRRSNRGFESADLLEITALSRGDEELDRRLSAFPASQRVLFKSVRSQDGAYFNHGHFVLALAFHSEGRRRTLDCAALGPALTEIRRYLE